MSTKFISIRDPAELSKHLLQFQSKVRSEHGRPEYTAEEIATMAADTAACVKAAEESVELILSFVHERLVLLWGHLLSAIIQANFSPALPLSVYNVVTAQTTRASLRLQLLQTIYNVVPVSSPERYDLYCQIVSFATQAKLANHVLSTFSAVSAWISTGSWSTLTAQKRRNLHMLMYNALLSVGLELKAYTTLVERLATYTLEEVRTNVAVDLAVAAAVLAIRLPEVHQCDELLALAAISHLAELPEHGTLHKLLSLFAADDLAGYLAFHQTHAEEIAKLGLSHEACLQKIRLFTLNTIASHSRVLSYEAISRSLQISISDVEGWVVLAVSNKLLDAKMDQIQSSVTINQTNQRIFTMTQWKDLSKRLHLWRDNVALCATSFSQVKPSSH